MKAAFILISLISTFLWTSCQSNSPEQQTEQKLHEEIMAVHDEVMPKMSEINRLTRELKKVADSGSPYDEGVRSTASQTVQQLEKADEAMMGWMESYKIPSKMRGERTHENIMQYLEEEKGKIEMVKSMMLESIQNGNQVLAGIKKAE